MTQRIVVLGGSGAVGSAVVGELRRLGHDAVTVGRDPARADVAVDVVRDPDGWRDALDGADAVVNASGLEEVRVAAVAHARGVPFVDISATGGYLEVLRAGLTTGGTPGVLVTDVGIAPGVSNVLAAEVHRRSPGPVDVGVVLGAGEHHGKAATRWTFDMLGRSFVDPATGRRVRNYTGARTFEVAGTRHHLVRADFADQHTMTRELGSPVRTYFGLDDPAATRTLTFATWSPAHVASRTSHP
ncbi:NAD-dependent epimerase/dehydratase family protein [Sanguibacter suaedae]|uniref:NAD-dependent epimerase/dehydratase family protein n=1 Tax=Sanguibacter suaedae TaxID=2795737 RepID=A0A934IEX9_9MICO|nr:NAD-dependent epimerase/dehydratase family protein [Sanguibacter suaedae]MBI9115689.1 NAD-dependent epimerase/dehydratase family protein [Sanguibacter suaedae]